MKAAVLTIGDEILLGQTLNTNTTWICNELTTLGLKVTHQLTIADNITQITNALTYLANQCELVLITGGLGPTKDDKTKESISIWLDKPLQINLQILEYLQKWYAKKQQNDILNLEDQASFPENSILLWNERGSAPGIWASKADCTIIALPGVPFEMKQIFSDEVKPRLKQEFKLQPLVQHYLRIAGISESNLALKIKDIEDQFPNFLQLAYLPELGSLLLRLTCEDNTTEAKETTLIFRRLIIDRLGQYVVSYLPESLEQYIVDYLKEHRITLGFAESCTGGLLGHMITNISGASSVYKGTINTYAEELKHELLDISEEKLKEYTAVSEEIAIGMVKNAGNLLHSDITLSVTGYLEATKEHKAFAWVAVMYKGEITTKKVALHYARKENKLHIANICLNAIRLCLINH